MSERALEGAAPASDAPAPPENIERWGWYSIGINIILALINWVVALASGSLAVQAEMVHNLVDLLTAIGVLVGLKLATRKSKAFPYGLYKVENVISVILGIMTFVTAYEIARDAILADAVQATVDPWMFGGVIVATAIPLAFSHFELRAGQEANSPALVADAREYRAHVFTTGVVLAALAGQWFDLPLDRIAALVIVVAIVKTGWELLADGMRVLLDASLDPETLVKIREAISAEPTVSEVIDVTGRNAGRYRFVEATVTLRVQELERAEAATQRIEALVHEACPHVDRVLVHAEPVHRTHLWYALPLADREGALSEHFGDAPYFGMVQLRLADGAIEEERTLSNPFLNQEKAKGIQVAEWLVEQKADIVLLKEDLHGKGPVYVFGDAGIGLEQTGAGTIGEAMEEQRGVRVEAAGHTER
jgi:cation diffusion facilitator family transporter